MTARCGVKRSAAPLVELAAFCWAVVPLVTALLAAALVPLATVLILDDDDPVEAAAEAADVELDPALTVASSFAAARTVELKVPVMSSSVNLAEKASWLAVPLAAVLVDSARMK